MAVLGGVVLARTRWGYETYAVGGSAQAAEYAGIDTRRVRIRGFVLAALCLVQSVVLLLVLAIKVDFSAEVVQFTANGPVYHMRGEFLAPLGFLSALGGTLFLTSLTGLGLGLLISSAANSSDRAMSVIPIALVPQIVFAMALMPLPATVAWVSYATSSRFAMEALGAISRLPLPRDYSNCLIPGNPRSCAIYPSVDYDPGVGHVLQHRVPVGQRVAIIGAGGIGFDIAEYLLHDPAVPLPVPLAHWCAEWGVDLQARSGGGLVPPAAPGPHREIFLLQRKPGKPGAGLGKTTGWVHRAVLQRHGVQMLSGVAYERIDDAGLHIRVGDQARTLAVDHIVLCAGQEPLRELMPEGAEKSGAAPTFHVIGGAALASELDAKRAIREGAELAARL